MGNRGSFGSRFGVVAAVAGSVVGLGNIWRFPYVAGENGGAAFILIYIAVGLLISIPIMLSEFSIGRMTKRNAKRAYQKIAPRTQWKLVGYMGIITSFIILSFYAVVAGWALEFIKESVMDQFANKSAAEISANFASFEASGWRPILWILVFIAGASTILVSGIEKGVERYNKIFMPVFIVLLIGLFINSLTLSNAQEGYAFILHPDFSKITGRTVLAAIGQSFFSMSLGMGAMVTYGSYIKKGENMFKVAGMVAFADTAVAILAGLTIFPAVFSFGISPTSGPDLVFLTLPNIFSQMPGGYFISIIFFCLLFLAAITPSISLFEVIVIYLVEEMRISRRKAVLWITATITFTGSLCALSRMPDSVLRIGGVNLFDILSGMAPNILMPVGGLLVVIFTGWVIAPQKLKAELTNKFTIGMTIYPVYRVLVKFVIPVVISILFLSLMGLI